jgi:hypothetical protein
MLTTVTLASSNNVLPDDGDCTEIFRNSFNVNFNVNFKIVFKIIHLCISWWIKKPWWVRMFLITSITSNSSYWRNTRKDFLPVICLLRANKTHLFILLVLITQISRSTVHRMSNSYQSLLGSFRCRVLQRCFVPWTYKSMSHAEGSCVVQI